MDVDQQELHSGRHIGTLSGHSGWVTKIAVSPSDPDMIITSSRDKTAIIWKLVAADDGSMTAKKQKSLIGHNHFVSDCAFSKDGGFLITSSWDKTLRLWDIQRGVSKRKFIGHSNDITCVAFSSDNRQILSGSRDRTVRLWNTLAVQKYVFERDGHQDCVSSVQAVSSKSSISILSAGHDGVIKTWQLTPTTKCVKTFHGHNAAINSISVSPDYNLMISGGNDGIINLWKLEADEFIKRFEAGGQVSTISFNPCHFNFAAGVGSAVQVYSVNTHNMLFSLIPDDVQDVKTHPKVVSLSWSNDGTFLFVGYTDNKVRIFCFKRAFE